MLKDKEVISDPVRQFDIARRVHALQHGGINKTTATIAEKYHWSRIKETVSDVIRSCTECRELSKTPNPGGVRKAAVVTASTNTTGGERAKGGVVVTASEHENDSRLQDGTAMDGTMTLTDHDAMPSISQVSSNQPPSPFANPADISLVTSSHPLQHSPYDHSLPLHHHDQQLQSAHHHHQHPHHNPMLQDPPTGHHHHSPNYQPIDPQIINQSSPHDLSSFDPYHSPADFQALLNATEDIVPGESDSVDRDLDMLIEHPEDDDIVDGTVSMGGMDDRGLNHKGRTLYDVEFGPSSGGG